MGGGIIGCSAAYALAQAGMRVRVLERQALASGASGVAAGMLAPQVEAAFDDDFFELTLAGRAEHPALADVLREDTGIDVEYQATGVLRVAVNESERVELQRRWRWQTARGLRAEWVEPRELGSIEPLLSGVAGRLLAGGLWLPDEAQVRPPRLVRALATAAERRGVQFTEAAWVTGLVVEAERVVGVRLPTGRVSAETIILAAGVWSGDLLKQLGLAVPVGPVKGQIIQLRGDQRHRPRAIVWSGECYIVPRLDGEVTVGATEEDGSYDARPTLAGMRTLSEAACELLPAAARLNVEGMWAGLRPAAPDRYPIVGWASDVQQLMLATAHYRNGVLLGPLTGRLVAGAVAGAETLGQLAPFGPARFQTDARQSTRA